MTLQNLRHALYLNNLKLLERINEVKDLIDTLSGTDIAEINKSLEELQKLIDEAEKVIKDNEDIASKHIANTVIHVTQEDKDLWNSILKSAKDYAKSLFDGVTSFRVIKVEELPEEPEILTIYLLSNNKSVDKNYYDEYMYIDDKWEIVGSTHVNLEPYALKEDVENELKKYVLTTSFEAELAKLAQSDVLKDYVTNTSLTNTLKNYVTNASLTNALKDYTTNTFLANALKSYALKSELHKHENKTVLDKFSVSNTGVLLYNGEEIKYEEEPESDEAIQGAIDMIIKNVNGV